MEIKRELQLILLILTSFIVQFSHNDINAELTAREYMRKGVALINQLGGITSLKSLPSLPAFPKYNQLSEAEEDNKLNEGISLLEKAIELDNSLGEAYFFLGMAYIKAKRIDAATEMFLRAIELQPDEILSYDILINIYLDQRNYEGAFRIAEKLRQNLPNKMALYYSWLGRIHLMIGNYRDVLKYVDKAMQFGENDKLSMLLLKARAYHNLGDNRKALGCLELALKGYPEARKDIESFKKQLGIMNEKVR